MSVNYHAFQSRGVRFAEYEVVSEQWRSTFAGFDPGRIAGILGLEADERYLYLSYFGVPYRLRLEDGHLEKQNGEVWSEELYFNESMAIYHLLYYTKDEPAIAGSWVPNHALDGVVSRSASVQDPLLADFCKTWTGRVEELAKACQRLGGRQLSRGDAAFQFAAFPCISLQLVFWDADEDFPAQAQVLVDEQVTDFVHYETVGCIVSDLLEMLEK